MLFSLCWSNPYAFKMLMKDLRLSFSQFGSSDTLKNFPCESKTYTVALQIWQINFGGNWMCLNLGGNWKSFPN
jgi:hypothetical protein